MEVRDKTETFRPEFFATDATDTAAISVGHDCPDEVFHASLLQSSSKGGECIHTWGCPQGTECTKDQAFADAHPQLAWTGKKTCRPKAGLFFGHHNHTCTKGGLIPPP